MPDKGAKPKQQSILSRLFSPTTTAPSRIGSAVAGATDTPRMGSNFFDPNSMMGRYEQLGNRVNAGARGMLAGMAQGAGDVASDMTSPVSLISSLMGLGGLRRAGQMAGNAASGMSRVVRPTIDIIEDAPPVRQVMPGMSEVDDLIGQLQGNLSRVPSRRPPQLDMSPFLRRDLVPIGGEGGFNNAIPQAMNRFVPSPADTSMISKASRKRY